MTETMQPPPYTLEPDDKVAKVMAYTASTVLMGEVVVKELIRVSTWLRTNSAPDWIALYNARVMQTCLSSPPRPEQFKELNVAVSQILGFHLVPPAHDPPDYDPTEPNRRMLPVTVLLGTFRIQGHIRVAAQTSLRKYVDVTQETYTSIYDAKISNIAVPALGVMSVPFLLVRQENVSFALC
ncbi:MAG: hypothetical protein GX491_17785 [Chloroflexi bacterium]|nr:hypothetical protein [Chloroflexota bacterium]